MHRNRFTVAVEEVEFSGYTRVEHGPISTGIKLGQQRAKPSDFNPNENLCPASSSVRIMMVMKYGSARGELLVIVEPEHGTNLQTMK